MVEPDLPQMEPYEPPLELEELLPESEGSESEDEYADLLEYPAETELPPLEDDEAFLEYPEEPSEIEALDEDYEDTGALLEEEEPAEEPVLELEEDAGIEPALELEEEPAMEQVHELEEDASSGLAPDSPEAASMLTPESGSEPHIITEAPAITESKVLNLFQYLKTLTEELPEEPKKNFKASEARLKMEYVIDKLEGRKGLLRELEEKRKQLLGTSIDKKEGQVTANPNIAIRDDATEPLLTTQTAISDDQSKPKESLAAKKPDPAAVIQTLSYLTNLAKGLPDRDLSSVIERKVTKVVQTLSKDGGTRD
ncbi:MAG: hypothetical protein SNJ56_02095 [Termitinemataceae bacterium]